MKTVFPAVSASKLSWVSSMALAPVAAAARPTNRAVNFMVVIAVVKMRISTEARGRCLPKIQNKILLDRREVLLLPPWAIKGFQSAFAFIHSSSFFFNLENLMGLLHSSLSHVPFTSITNTLLNDNAAFILAES